MTRSCVSPIKRGESMLGTAQQTRRSITGEGGKPKPNPTTGFGFRRVDQCEKRGWPLEDGRPAGRESSTAQAKPFDRNRRSGCVGVAREYVRTASPRPHAGLQVFASL